ncbi:LysR substrate-binding domain-containing protein [Dongia soli]|uniref:LysR substrate-binding domain-containing protein n=1 Tax=Dongia soli TaxID=600628 RepID=A0ABU5E550_9PROT|nr:LysR substrate-binding domain-containing protein [Dongia soli]MDY0881291.1 LysR substrate-binding domain-containing protein [Dongia soli]
MRARLTRSTFPGSAALRSFESAGRLLSFKRAAQELNVTEAAISFQIRQLEEELGAELFERGHRQVKLTPAGRAYLGTVQQAHRDLMMATLSLTGQEKAQVRVSTMPALAEHWLVPRLGSFMRRHPDIAVSVLASSDLVDLDRDEVDVAIRYGSGHWSRAEIRHLMDETILPVAHPKIARKLARRKIDASTNIPLISNLQHPDEWAHFLPDLPGGRHAAGLLRLETSVLVLRAAVEQLGIAIGRRPFVDDFIARGELVPLTDQEQPTGKGYFILTPKGRKGMRPEIAHFVDALCEFAAAGPEKT